MNTTKKGKALDLISRFRRSTRPTNWVNMKRADVADQMMNRVLSPRQVSSKVVNECGPAAFFYNLLEDDPETYVWFISQIYEQDEGNLGRYRVQDNQGFLKANLQTSTIPQGMDAVDWLAMASLRNQANAVLRNNSGSDSLAGLTMPSGLADWFSAAGYRTVVNETNVFLTKGEDHIRRANTLFLHERYRVCLFINADMLDPKQQTTGSFCPDHWVTLASPIWIVAGASGGPTTINLRVHSWGEIMNVPRGAPLKLSDFLDNYYGFVAAKP